MDYDKRFYNITWKVHLVIVAILALGLQPRQGLARVRAKREARECGKSVRMDIHTPKWAPMLGVGVLVDSRIFREWLQWSKPIALRNSLYHWKAIET
jgi:hypothetical protein